MLRLAPKSSNDVVPARRSPNGPETLSVDNEREYLKGRASAELKATFLSSCIEAKYVHNALTHAYIEKCFECSPDRTQACIACRFRNVCDQVDGPFSEALIDAEYPLKPRSFADRSFNAFAEIALATRPPPS